MFPPLAEIWFYSLYQTLGSSDFEFTKKKIYICHLSISLTNSLSNNPPDFVGTFLMTTKEKWFYFPVWVIVVHILLLYELNTWNEKKMINSPFVMVTIKFNTWTLEGDLQIISPYNITKKEMIFCWLKKTLIAKKILLISSAENVKRTV